MSLIGHDFGEEIIPQLRIPLNVITGSGIVISDSGDHDHPPERSEV